MSHEKDDDETMPEDSRAGGGRAVTHGPGKPSGIFYLRRCQMEKGQMITQEEARKICMTIATNLRYGVLDEIQVMHDRMFDEVPTGNELEHIWIIAGQYLSDIINYMNETLEDIEAGRYLSKA
jgi:hypothetical protein